LIILIIEVVLIDSITFLLLFSIIFFHKDKFLVYYCYSIEVGDNMTEIKTKDIIMNIKTKEYLLSELDNYKDSISPNLYIYLYNLINLNMSALEDKTNTLEVSLFKNTSFYRDIVAYNIYNYTFNYYLNNPDLRIDDQTNNIKIYRDNYKLFDFYHDENYEDLKIGEVNFYKTVYDPNYNLLMDEKLSRKIKEESESLYKNIDDNISSFDIEKKIEHLKKELLDLRNSNIPNEEENNILAMYEVENNNLMNHFNINDKGFNLTKDYNNIKRKTLFKNINGINVYKNLRYM